MMLLLEPFAERSHGVASLNISESPGAQLGPHSKNHS